LWFLNRDKPKKLRDKVLMLNARDVYRKVTRKIYDFSPEQQKNLLAIVWLYRGQSDRFLRFHPSRWPGRRLSRTSPSRNSTISETLAEFQKEQRQFAADVADFQANIEKAAKQWEKAADSNAALNKLVEQLGPLAETSRDLIRQADLAYKLATRLIELCEADGKTKDNDAWVNRDVIRARKAADEFRGVAVEQLKQVRYFWKQAHWLTERFPKAELCDVVGLVKLVGRSEIEANDWSLTPGRYVGVAPEEVDEDFDFEESLREIHVKIEDLNTEAVTLAATIKKNFEELGI